MKNKITARLFGAALLVSLLAATTASANIEAYVSTEGKSYVRLEPDSDNSTLDSYLVVSDTPVTVAIRSTKTGARAVLSPAGEAVSLDANGFSVFTLQPGTNRRVDFGAKKSAVIVVGQRTPSAAAAKK